MSRRVRVPTLAPIPSLTPCLFRHPIPTPVPLSILFPTARAGLLKIANTFSYSGGIVTIA